MIYQIFSKISIKTVGFAIIITSNCFVKTLDSGTRKTSFTLLKMINICANMIIAIAGSPRRDKTRVAKA